MYFCLERNLCIPAAFVTPLGCLRLQNSKTTEQKPVIEISPMAMLIALPSVAFILGSAAKSDNFCERGYCA
jgi:hypothetical protein